MASLLLRITVWASSAAGVQSTTRIYIRRVRAERRGGPSQVASVPEIRGQVAPRNYCPTVKGIVRVPSPNFNVGILLGCFSI